MVRSNPNFLYCLQEQVGCPGTFNIITVFEKFPARENEYKLGRQDPLFRNADGKFKSRWTKITITSERFLPGPYSNYQSLSIIPQQ